MRAREIADLLIRHHKKLALKYQDVGEYGKAEIHALRAEELEREQDQRANHEAAALAALLEEMN